MKNIIASLLNGTNVNIEIAVTPSSESKLQAAFTENLPKLKKMSKVQRPRAIGKLITNTLPEIQVAVSIANGETYTYTEKKGRRSCKPVYQFDQNGNLLASFPSVQEAHRSTGIADSSICYCANNKYGFKTAGGFKWSYSAE